MKAGLVILWYGIAANVPYGWKICDGQFGTPDFRDRIPVGAGLNYNVGDIGGSAEHVHDYGGDGHAHQLVVFGGVELAAANYRQRDGYTDSQYPTGTTDPESSMPKYRALYYIQRM